MAYSDTVGDIVRLTTVCRFPNNQWQMYAIHLQCLSAGGGDSRLTICTMNDAAFRAHYKPFMSNLSHFYGSSVHIVKALAKWLPVTTIADELGGTVGVPLPTQVRPILSWYTAMAGPSGRGRNYMPTPASAQQDAAGEPNPTLLGGIGAYAGVVGAGFGTSGSLWKPVVLHRSPTAPITLSTTAITSYAASTKWATQRKGGDYGRVNVAPWISATT